MTTELQEIFKNYVFESVKANIDEWNSLGYLDYESTETGIAEKMFTED